MAVLLCELLWKALANRWFFDALPGSRWATGVGDADYLLGPGYYALVAGNTPENIQCDCLYEDGIAFAVPPGGPVTLENDSKSAVVDVRQHAAEDDDPWPQCELVRVRFDNAGWLAGWLEDRVAIFLCRRAASLEGLAFGDGQLECRTRTVRVS